MTPIPKTILRDEIEHGASEGREDLYRLICGRDDVDHPRACTWAYAVLAAVVGYFVLTRMEIVEVVSAMLFTSLLTGLGIAPYSRTILKVGREMAGEGFGRLWPLMAIWAVIAVWVLYAVLVSE